MSSSMMYPALLQQIITHQMQNTFRVPQFSWVHPPPTMTQPSPPSSPPTSCATGCPWTPRTHHSRVPSFTIDAILGHQNTSHKSPVSPEVRKKIPGHDMRISARPSPYPCNPVEAVASPAVTSGPTSSPGKASKSKRIRTIFTAEQLERLEAEFSRQQYMVGPERVFLANSLQLSEAQVKVWFQNRRIKWRKQFIEKQHGRFSSVYSDGHDRECSRSPISSPEQLDITSTDVSDCADEVLTQMEKVPERIKLEKSPTSPASLPRSRSPSPLSLPSASSSSISPSSSVTSRLSVEISESPAKAKPEINFPLKKTYEESSSVDKLNNNNNVLPSRFAQVYSSEQSHLQTGKENPSQVQASCSP